MLLTRAFEAALAAPEGEPPPAGWDGECVRDRMGEAVDAVSEVACARGATVACLASCRDGNGRSCAEAAYALEHADDPEAHHLYRRGCAYGDMNACTNYGAWLSLFLRDDAAALRCAYEVFVATCATGDHFGCGMQGSLLSGGRGVEADPEAATELLRVSCRDLGQFPCDTLAFLGATEVLPSVTLEEAQQAFETACRTGYETSCGRSAVEVREANRAEDEE